MRIENICEEPMFKDGTEIEFSDGSIAVIETKLNRMGDYENVLSINGKEESIDYLISRVWKVIK